MNFLFFFPTELPAVSQPKVIISTAHLQDGGSYPTWACQRANSRTVETNNRKPVFVLKTETISWLSKQVIYHKRTRVNFRWWKSNWWGPSTEPCGAPLGNLYIKQKRSYLKWMKVTQASAVWLCNIRSLISHVYSLSTVMYFPLYTHFTKDLLIFPLYWRD